MARRKVQRHYCKICGMRKSNESFSGKGHAAHICKVCSRLSPVEQAEQMTLRRLENLPLRRLSENGMPRLKNRMHDHRPEVKSLACAVFAERSPRAARDQKKQELSIRDLEIFVNGEIIDKYGDLMALTENYQVSRVPPTIVRTQQDGISQTIGPPPKILAKLLKWTVHTLEIFWWGEDLCGHADIEDGTTAVEDPSWRIHVEYSNGIIQDTASADEIPDHVADLLLALLEFFE